MLQDGAHGRNEPYPPAPERAAGPGRATPSRRGRDVPFVVQAHAARARRGRALGRAAAVLSAWFWALAVAAAPAPADPCEAAALAAADAHGVPLAVMRAVLRVETGEGRGAARRGWPWSANADGRSYRFDSFDAALAFARGSTARTAGNVDLGCFQISERWHGQEFAGPAEMLDPRRNALYAARLLAGHHGRLGDWTLAAGAYHSMTEPLAAAYRARFRTELATLGEAPATRLAAAAPTREAATPREPTRGAAPLRPHGRAFSQVVGLAPAPGRVGSPEVEASGEGPILVAAAAPPDLSPDSRRLEPVAPLPSHPPLVARPSPLQSGARPLLDGAGPGAAGSLVPASGGSARPLFHRAPGG